MGNPLGENAGGQSFDAGNVGGAGAGDGTQGGNPAWQEFYQAVPQEYHEAVTPLLQKWDQGVNQRFTQVQQEYAPWNNVIQSGNTPDDVTLALNVLQTMVNNPREIYDALNSQYNFADQTTGQGSNNNQGAGANTSQGQNEPDLQTAYDQRFQQVEQNFQRLAQFMLDKQQTDVEAQEDAQLDAELAGLRKKHGDFDEDYVLSKMYSGHSAEEAVQMYQQFLQRAHSAAQPRPLLLGQGGGAAPGLQKDPRKMTDNEAKSSALQMVMAMNAANQQ